MEIRHLEYFIEVARQKSFSKAADQMHISQPSISKVIKEIENHFGVILFYRTTKYVELTDAGEIILEQAEKIVSSFQNINANLVGDVKLKSGKIRIGIPPITGLTTFARLFGPFSKAYPNINIQLFEFGSKKIEIGILDGTLDVGIICIPPRDQDLYEMICSIRDPLRLVLHPEHPFAKCAVMNYANLINESFVLYSNDFSLNDLIMERCRQAGFRPNIIFETLQLELMTQLVADHFGIALLPSTVCQHLDAKALVSIPLADPPVYLQLGMAWKKDRYISHATKEWLQFVKNKVDFNDKDSDITRQQWFWDNAAPS
jgi:DNA-binding transcriptional LysR family regulator